MVRVQGPGSRVQGPGFRFWGQVSGFRGQGFRETLWEFALKVESRPWILGLGLGIRVHGLWDRVRLQASGYRFHFRFQASRLTVHGSRLTAHGLRFRVEALPGLHLHRCVSPVPHTMSTPPSSPPASRPHASCTLPSGLFSGVGSQIRTHSPI